MLCVVQRKSDFSLTCKCLSNKLENGKIASPGLITLEGCEQNDRNIFK